MRRYDAIGKSLDRQNVGDLDKAWWGIVCILPDGLLDTDQIAGLGAPVPFGTQKMYIDHRRDFYISLLSAERVCAISEKWQRISRESLSPRYFELGKTHRRELGILKWLWPWKRHWYHEYVSDDDFEYVWEYCESSKDFFAKSARKQYAVLLRGSG